MSAIGSALLGLTVLVCASACSDSTDPGGPSELAAVSPLTSTGVAGEPVSPPPSVIVTDSRGRPVTGVVVAFTVEGGGTISTPEDTTNTSGVAAIQRWVLGPAVGTNRVTASVPGLEPVIFTATGNAGAPASMEKVSGDNQTTISGSPVPAAPTVLIRDINGNPVSGVAVSFTVAPGDIAVLTGGEQTTNESGLAAVGSWRPGGRQALYTLRAAAGNLSVAFRATVVFGPASTLSLVS